MDDESQAFRDGVRHGRKQAAKEHARMVRDVFADLPKGAGFGDIALAVERVAQAIEKGSKQ